MQIYPADQDAEMLRESKECASQLSVLLQERVQAVSFTQKSKLPFKAGAIRELLLHRTVALANVAVDLFEENKVVPAVILTRSIVETFAMLFVLHERIVSFLKGSKDINVLDEFLMSCLVGARDNSEMPKAINVLNFIDRVGKLVPAFRGNYEALCECAHPNWAGTFGSFGKPNCEAIEIELGFEEKTPMYTIGLSALSGTLINFLHYYLKSGDLVRQLNDFFDQREDGAVLD